MKTKKILETTSCSATYNKALKRYRSHYIGICDRCKYHCGENADRPEKSWKIFRRYQWKN